MPPFVANKKEAFICSQWWEKWTLRVLDNFGVVWYIKGSCFFNTAAHRGAIQASCYPMTSKTNCTTMVFKKCCITTRTRASGEWNHLHISIHLMFLLILYHISYRIPKNIISIHLMFLLIWSCCHLFAYLKLISIHLMFLLIPYVSVITGAASMYFNTSHVSINLSADDIV